jgi:hypothetical protein
VNAHCHRHTPVYFFFCSPTLTDICISMTIIPKVLVNIQKQDQSITSVGCLTQINSVLTFGGLENCLLDNCGLWSLYGHLSPPLRYTVIMNPCVCVFLVLSSWLLALLSPCSIVWWCCTCPSAHTWKFPASSVNLLRSSSSLFWCLHQQPPPIPSVKSICWYAFCWDYFLLRVNFLLFFEDPIIGEKA